MKTSMTTHGILRTRAVRPAKAKPLVKVEKTEQRKKNDTPSTSSQGETPWLSL